MLPAQFPKRLALREQSGSKRRRYLFILALMSLISVGCSTKLTDNKAVLKTVLGTVEPYFHTPQTHAPRFEQLTDHIYTYQWSWYRNLIIDTSAGLVIIDPMNADMARDLHAELSSRFNDKPVHTLIYSHYHLDHSRGGGIFAPQNVLADHKAPLYWEAANVEMGLDGVVAPTAFFTGDEVFTVGDVEIHALHMGDSHTDTLYAFHFPQDQLLFTADLGLVRTMAPNGVPDRYSPGYDAAMARLLELDFAIFVPSHFGFGTKQDLAEWRDMMAYSRHLAAEAIELYGGPGIRKGQWRQYVDYIHPRMKERYGAWHGFSDMFVLNLVRDVVGEALAY